MLLWLKQVGSLCKCVASFSRSTTDWTQRGDTPDIEDDESILWKRLCFSPGAYSSRWVMGCLHNLANVQQTSSNSRVFWIHLLEVCWTFA